MKNKPTFDSVSYRGGFRDYQRHLLMRVESRLDDSKLNIVTPPGSGKVLLGLEIAHHIGNPCIILTANASLCHHWGDCFIKNFLPQGANAEEYLSYDFLNPALVTCMTYEALYAAINKASSAEDANEPDLSGVDFIRLVQEEGIGTVVLDEPHHLHSRWQKSLETFLGVLGGEMRLLSLTAVAPYDLDTESWNRYVALCGDVTDEIHIPELVMAQALCPHEDLVYFNYPSDAENQGITGYRRRVDKTIAEAISLPFMGEMNRRLSKLNSKNSSFIFSHWEGIVALLELLHEYGQMINTNMYRQLTGRKVVAPLTLAAAQIAFNFLLESQTVLRDNEKDKLYDLFSSARLMEHHQILLTMTEKVRHTVASSVGKLDSIAAITQAESEKLGDALRQVVLTDTLREEDVAYIGTGRSALRVSTATVFDTLRTRCHELPLGCISQSAIVLPLSLESVLVNQYGMAEEAIYVEKIAATDYGFYRIEPVETRRDVVGRLFSDGHIRVLIGSMDVLNSGWHDRFVNTLVIAAFHASFSDIHHARGRAIHVDPKNPDKVTHIWHLATVEPDYATLEDPELRLASRIMTNEPGLTAVDSRILRNRFECFIGPNYETGELENGMARLGINCTAVSESRMKKINTLMLNRINHRESLARTWISASRENTLPVAEVMIPRTARLPVFTPFNTIVLLLSIGCVLLSVFNTIPTLIVYALLSIQVAHLVLAPVVVLMVINLSALLVAVLFILRMLPLVLSHFTVSMSIRSTCYSVLKALKELGLVSRDATPIIRYVPLKKAYCVYLDDCSFTQQTIFQQAVAEMLSPIETSRYVIVRGGWFRRLLFRWSFACPSAMSRNDVSVKVFEKHIRPVMGSMKFQFTRRELGRRYLIQARNKSYINVSSTPCEKKIHLLKHDYR